MEPRYYLRCLSQPTLFGPSGEPLKFKVRKHFALLVYLAVHARTPQRRDHLAELLWGSAQPDEARHSLATALSVLRGKLGPAAIEKAPDSIRFAHPAFLTDLERLAAGDLFASEDRPTLEVAGFLDGFDVADAHEFMLWKEGQHARWLPDIRTALVRLMDRCRRTGDSRQIETLADQMLRLDELSEEGIRAKMEARAFAGDRLTALRVYEAWQERLAEELGAQPSALVEGMAMRLRRRGWERPVESPIATVPTDQWKNRPFIGRAAEYRMLYEGWEATQRGEPGHVLVLGESGIGKSTLAERLATAAGLEGASVVRVQCYEPEKEIPYTAVGSLTNLLLDRPGASATRPEALAELSRTVAEVRRKFPSIPPSVESQGEAARVRLAEAFYDLIIAVAEEHPLILIVDDLHQTDDASLAVLHLVLRKARGRPLQALFLARSSELLESPNASRLYERSGTLAFRILELPPLSEEEADELIDSLVSAGERKPGVTVRRSLLRAATGYPMALELLIKDWQTCGDKCLALTFDAMTTNPELGTSGAAAFRPLIERLTHSLDSNSRNVLNLAALLGNRINDFELYSLIDLTLGQTMAGMARLTDMRLLRDGEHGLEFVNELVRAFIYFMIPSPLRRSLHGIVASHLVQTDRDPALGLETARHCIRAGRVEEAKPYLVGGAEAALDRGALHEAERAISTALPLLTDATRERCVLLLAEAFQAQGRWQESLDTLASHDADAAGLQVWSKPSQAHAFVLTTIARSRLGLIPGSEAATLVEALGIAMRDARSPRIASLAARACATIASFHRDAELSKKALDGLERMRIDHWPILDRARFKVSATMLSYFIGDLTKSRALSVEAADLVAQNAGPSLIAADVLLGVGALQCAMGEYTEAAEILTNGRNLCRRMGCEAMARTATANLALCCGRIGKFEEQIWWSTKVLADDLAGEPHLIVLCLFLLANGQANLGRRDDAMNTVARLTSEPMEHAPLFLDQARLLYAAEVYELLGKTTEATKVALRGTTGVHSELRTASYAGLFAKWIAKTSTPTNREATLRRLRQFIDEIDKYDGADWEAIKKAAETLSSSGGQCNRG